MTALDFLRAAAEWDRTAEAAPLYAAGGIPVFPLHTPGPDGRCSCRRDCGRDNGKHPRTLHGLKDATTDPDKVAHWWGMWPEANIGLATGFWFWVLDIEAVDGEASIGRLEDEYGALSPTWSVVTGSGGLHLWFRHRTEYAFRNSVRELGDGLDVRTRGGYVVGPPSLHRSGNRYAWSEAWNPATVPLADAPPWLLRLVTTKGRGESGRAAPLGDDEVIGEGQRNDRLFGLGCAMRRYGFREAAILAALAVENADRCRPPLADDEVDKIAKSAAGYPVGIASIHAKPYAHGVNGSNSKSVTLPSGARFRGGARHVR
jgi:putative DNA primase/helicase